MSGDHVIETPHWRLRISETPNLGRTICVATIHPVGDQRVLRCAQAVLDGGYDVHLVWLGGEPGFTRHHDRVKETRLAGARGLRDRIFNLPRVFRKAWATNADLWHIHDFYFLPFALIWSLVSRRPVIYDVHEYYPEAYAEKVPDGLRPMLRGALGAVEIRAAASLGAANVVSAALASRFATRGVQTALTPNYPSVSNFPIPARPLTPALLRRVIHIGSLTPDYGSAVLISMALELQRVAPDVELIVIARFFSTRERTRFLSAVERAGPPANLRLLDPVPVHQIPPILASCGIGLSVMQDVGQSPLVVPTKLYEYAIGGLAIVGSELPGAREFIERSAHGRVVRPDSGQAYAGAITQLIADADATCVRVNQKAVDAREELSWEAVCAPRIRLLVDSIDRCRR